MAVLTKEEARRERARKHARRTWECPVCGQVCRGNGGKASHKKMHLRRNNLDDVVAGERLRELFNSLWRDARKLELTDAQEEILDELNERAARGTVGIPHASWPFPGGNKAAGERLLRLGLIEIKHEDPQLRPSVYITDPGRARALHQSKAQARRASGTDGAA